VLANPPYGYFQWGLVSLYQRSNRSSRPLNSWVVHSVRGSWAAVTISLNHAGYVRGSWELPSLFPWIMQGMWGAPESCHHFFLESCRVCEGLLRAAVTFSLNHAGHVRGYWELPALFPLIMLWVRKQITTTQTLISTPQFVRYSILNATKERSWMCGHRFGTAFGFLFGKLWIEAANPVVLDN